MKKLEPSLFKRMDEFLFHKIDQFIQGPYHSKLQETLNGLPSEIRPYAAKGLLMATLFICPLILIIVSHQNSNFRARLETKQEINELASKIIRRDRQLSQLRSSLFAHGNISQSDFEEKVHQASNSAGLKPDLVQISDFHVVEENGISTASGKVEVSAMTLANLTQFLTEVVNNQKMKLGNLDITRDNETHFLKVAIDVVLYSSNQN